MNKPIHPAVAEHVMEENERLRGLLEELHPYVRGCSSELWDRYHAALSKQSDPADTYTAVDMATAAAQGFRDGQAAVEPAPAQDELAIDTAPLLQFIFSEYSSPEMAGRLPDDVVRVVRALEAGTRPAQTEQHPDVKSGNPDLWSVTAGGTDSDMEYVVVRRSLLEAIAACEWRGEMAASSGNELRAVMAGRISYGLYPAPVAQTASQPEQRGLAMAALRKAVAYLDENPFNQIESGSILHRVMGAALSAQGASK